jgi:hypothetical protein
MIEKIVLAIAITFSLYWVVQIKPPQRAIAVEIDFPAGTQPELQSEVVSTTKI